MASNLEETPPKKTMSSIPQSQLFVWEDIENSADFYRLQLVLRAIPDEDLMKKLETERGLIGNNAYPIRPTWNSLIAGTVYEHKTIESLRRELLRNPFLRQVCGFNVLKGARAVPTSGAYSRFIAKLMDHQDDLKKIFKELLGMCYQELEGFGESLAIDGKALPSFARRTGTVEGDRRGEHDANWGKHVVRTEGADGKVYEKKKTWFGFTLHLLVDTRYELPVEYTILPAADNEMPVAHKILDRMERENPEYLGKCAYLSGDRGYDDGKIFRRTWDDHKIKPIIDIRRSWKDGEESRAYEKAPGVVYNNKGEVFCVCPHFGDQKKMACRGFEKDRNCLKYCCPAEHYGIECKGRQFCELPKQVRIPLEEDRRIFTPVARDSYKWHELYKQRTAVERVNSRIDGIFGFENHTVRGLEKMSFRVTFAFILMLSFAVGKIMENKQTDIRKFLRAG